MIVLDTHTLIWWVDSPQKLSKRAKKTIEDHKLKEKSILVSSISTFEIYLLIKKGKLILTSHPDVWLEKIESLPCVHFVPVDNKIAALSVNLTDFSHRDPADRIIIATALHLGAKLVTSDTRIRKYRLVQSVW